MSHTNTRSAPADLAPASDDIDGRSIVTIRMLAADAVQAANSGHPGLPMGAAAPAYVLWSRFLRHDPTNPAWPDRDRFVLSAGHGSMLLYALLHLFGYDLPADEIKAFRQWDSRTPGHPEYGQTAGVETTTGPLGQGLGNAVGMALAERMLAARYRDLVDHRTYVLASDGDLMEGVSHEAASLAGHLRLGRLIVLYDDNHITIDGGTELCCSDDACARFAAYGWQVLRVADANDLTAVQAALRTAVLDEARPSLIAIRSHIGFGSPAHQDTAAAHGSPLGEDDLAATRTRYGWPPGEPFFVPADVRGHFARLAEAGRVRRAEWQARLDALRTRDPRLAGEWERTQAGHLPDGIDVALPVFDNQETLATRKAANQTLCAVARLVPELIGGSADLAGSTGAAVDAGSVSAEDFSGANIHFGVREHAMAAVCNGIALHRGLRPFCGTFLVFSDYLRPSLRLSALMGLPVIYLFSHDSIGLGEDGPTHQPVEHLTSLRAIPNLAVVRPADAHETAQALAVALRRTSGPTALILSRQGLPTLPPPPEGFIARAGARVVRDTDGSPEVALVATGSEVSLALAAADLLAGDGVAARVVSVPWRERFIGSPDGQDMLPAAVPRVIIEAGAPDGWLAVAGHTGHVLGLRRFGASAPGPVVMARLGFTADAVREVAHDVIAAGRGW